MNNAKRNAVRWADGSYDRHLEKCEHPRCSSDHYEADDDGYNEIITKQSYVTWMEGNTPYGRTDDGIALESPLANPDVLAAPDEEMVQGISEEMDEARQAAFESLTDRQQQVWDLCMRQGLTEREAADKLGILRSVLNRYLNAAKAKFVEYLRENGGNDDVR